MISNRVLKCYCCEDVSLIENYDKAINDNSQIWECHHRLETDQNLTKQELIEMNRYYNVPASELIFLTKSEHSKIHNLGKNNKGKEPWNKGLVGCYSEEYINKLSESHIGLKYPNRKNYPSNFKGHHHTDEAKEKNRIAHLGRIPWNKGLKKGT